VKAEGKSQEWNPLAAHILQSFGGQTLQIFGLNLQSILQIFSIGFPTEGGFPIP
jgi:hypothetical protein